jgi:hypothetical protein
VHELGESSQIVVRIFACSQICPELLVVSGLFVSLLDSLIFFGLSSLLEESMLIL